MAYQVKEMFYTLQGEGRHAGRPAVFVRFAGCNLWSGREQDRAGAVCKFCDTAFVGTDGEGGGRFANAGDMVEAAVALWPVPKGPRFVVFTGGEPALQIDDNLIDAFHVMRFEIALETNGTLAVPDGIDWICVSPKSTATLVQTRGDELKLVYPQADALPERFENLNFQHFALQPMDGPSVAENTEAAVAYCKAHPKWRLSLQTHKVLGIP